MPCNWLIVTNEFSKAERLARYEHRDWGKIYREKAPNAVSWYRPHLETSLEQIERAAAAYNASIIDVGGGESTLVDDLLLRGYKNLTVLDVSQTAIDVTKKRLGSAIRLRSHDDAMSHRPQSTLLKSDWVQRFDCGAMTTPEQAMQCYDTMQCSSHGHEDSQECCKSMPSTQAPFVQPASAHGLSLPPVCVSS